MKIKYYELLIYKLGCEDWVIVMIEKNFFNVSNNKERLRLFCFPYAGSGASVFRSWQEKLGDKIQIYPAHYPGHEDRISEKPIQEMDILVTKIYEEIDNLRQCPFYLFGHSMGSKIVYELAVRFEENHQENLKGIIVSAGLVPKRMEPKPIYDLPDNIFFAELSKYSRTPIEIFENKDLWNIFSSMLRADFKISDTYCEKKCRKLHIPILALRGTLDSEISLEDLKQWSEYTTSEFSHADIEGGHLFIDTNTDKVLNIIKKYIEVHELLQL